MTSNIITILVVIALVFIVLKSGRFIIRILSTIVVILLLVWLITKLLGAF